MSEESTRYRYRGRLVFARDDYDYWAVDQVLPDGSRIPVDYLSDWQFEQQVETVPDEEEEPA